MLLSPIFAILLSPSLIAQCKQLLPAQAARVPSQQQPAGGRQPVLTDQQVATIPAMMAALPSLPNVPPPLFREPNDDCNSRFQTLMSEYMTSLAKKGEQVTPLGLYQGLAKSLQDRARELSAQYGSHDPRAISPLEDAAFVLFTIHEVETASRLLDQAIHLREGEGTQSVAYWRDLRLRCTLEVQEANALQLQDCDQAVQLRSKQVGASPLELASWLRTLGLSSYRNQQRSMEYQERSLDYYARVPGISPAFLTSEYRRLAILALSLGNNEHGFHLNDLTNQYLSRGDAAAQKAIVTTEALKAAASAPLATLNLTPAQQKQIEDAQRNFREQFQKFKTDSEARPQDTMLNQFNLFNQFYARSRSGGPNKTLSDEPQSAATFMFCPSDQMIKLWEAMIFPRLKIESIKERLNSVSDIGLYFASTWEACSKNMTHAGGTGSPGDAFRLSASMPVPGYGTMVRVKGAFSESLAPRKMTAMPGHGESREQNARILREAAQAERMITRAAVLSAMTPEEQQAFQQLPKDAQDQTLQKRWSKMEKEDPERAKELMGVMSERALQTPEGQKYAKDFLTVWGMGDPSQFRPLAFLDTLKPHETFVDIYEYRIKKGNGFGEEHYLAVASESPSSAKKVQLGPAVAIDGAIDSFYDALNGGADLAPAWIELKQRIVQPILDAVPPGTERVWLSPDSKMISVPFASLLLDMGSPVQVTIIPSPYDFVRVRSTKPVDQGGVLFVGDLIYGQGPKEFLFIKQAKKEIGALSEEASGAHLEASRLSGSGVTRQVVIDHLRGVRFVHFSTHGFLENPVAAVAANTVLSGGVALSQANTGAPDAFLTSEDISHIDLSSVELVTLSACDTAQGRPVEGQGLLGFQTAFMAAGARSLLFSLWKAPLDQDQDDLDATSAFMESFYHSLWKQKLNKAAALRQAQAEVRSNPRFANPRFWATWVLVGEAW